MGGLIRNLGRSTQKKAITKMQAIGLAILVCIAIAVGAYYASFAPSPTMPSTETPPETPPETPKLPDLEVRKIMIDPVQPQAGNTFQAWIGIANIGEAKSGPYDLTIKIEDVSRGYTYPLGTFLQEPMDPTPPNQYNLVWQSDQLMVSYSGSHQLWAEITPIGFEDGDDSNNAHGLAFTAKP